MTKGCKNCSELFEAKTKWHIFCSNSCRVMNHEKKPIVEEAETVRVLSSGLMINKARGVKYSGNDGEMLISISDDLEFDKVANGYFEVEINYEGIRHTLKTCGNAVRSYGENAVDDVPFVLVKFRFSKIDKEVLA